MQWSRIVYILQSVLYSKLGCPAKPKMPSPESRGSRSLLRTSAIRTSLLVGRAPSSVGTVAGERTQRADLIDLPFFSLPDVDIVKMIGDAFGPELDRLTRAEPTAETGTVISKGNLGPNKFSPSQLLRGMDVPEVDRTVVGVLALKWLVSNDYDTFTAYQDQGVKLTRASFQAFRHMFLEGLQGSEEVYALIVATMINDLGKDDALWQEVKGLRRVGEHIPNHDEVVYQAAQLGLVPLLSDFPAAGSCYTSLMRGLRLGSGLNVPQLAQAENVPASLLAIEGLKSDIGALTLKFFEIILDVAGAQGHIDARCCLTMTEPVFQSYGGVRKALFSMIEQRLSPREAYDQVLDQRANLLSQLGFRHLRIREKRDRSLLRLLCLARAYSLKEAQILDKALSSMSSSQRDVLVNGLSVDGIDDGDAIIPYYAPSLFAVAFRRLRSSEQKIFEAVQAILRLLSRVYASHNSPEDTAGRVIECDLHFVQETLKSEAFTNDPSVLDNVEIPKNAYGDALESGSIAERSAILT